VVSSSLLPVPASSFLANLYSQACPKLFSLLDFNGNHNTGQAFLSSCTLYIYLAPEQFSCEEEKVL